MDIFKLKTVQLCAVTARPLSFILLFYLNLTYLTFLSHFSIHSHSSGHLLHLHLEFSFWFLIRALHLWPNILILSSCLTAFLLNFFFFLSQGFVQAPVTACDVHFHLILSSVAWFPARLTLTAQTKRHSKGSTYKTSILQFPSGWIVFDR